MAKTNADVHGTEKSGIEKRFDPTFATALALREKQIQQSYRPIIGVHKWFARRPGTIFRSLLLSEFSKNPNLEKDFWVSHKFEGVIADPFMGGGTPIFEANRLGFHVVGTDINPMAFWVVHQSLENLDLVEFRSTANKVISDVENEISNFYKTRCEICKKEADVKYFLWVKTANCPSCNTVNKLFPGHLLAEDKRHPANVLVCGHCGILNEYQEIPTKESPKKCSSCGHKVIGEGAVSRQKVTCSKCEESFSFLDKVQEKPLDHQVWALEYHCSGCKPKQKGRFFKSPDANDLKKIRAAQTCFATKKNLKYPKNEIPAGDESNRLHRWGYRFYYQMFNERQLLALGTLLTRIEKVNKPEIRHALLTVFSDFLRYQNMLCRYDTYALKCQDIFSVHGFPVGLVQCENNVLGIPKVGSGAYRHFIEKYIRAKEYCYQPFETLQEGKKKTIIPILGERIAAKFIDDFPFGEERQAKLLAEPAWNMPLSKESLDGVFTDPPYFDNVQYAELMDFCFCWLRLGLKDEFEQFAKKSTRDQNELTGNSTLGRGLDHFTAGLSKVFNHYSSALKKGAPFVFTYHHNDPRAYLPLVVAILDSGLDCTATLPAAAEMNASLHISGTSSSILDSVFVCRPIQKNKRNYLKQLDRVTFATGLEKHLKTDMRNMAAAGITISNGDLRCLAAGHIARLAINSLIAAWDRSKCLSDRMALASDRLDELSDDFQKEKIIQRLVPTKSNRSTERESLDATPL